MRWIMAAFYLVAGVGHLARPEAFLPIVPAWVPSPREIVLLTGVCEIAGALALSGLLKGKKRSRLICSNGGCLLACPRRVASLR